MEPYKGPFVELIDNWDMNFKKAHTDMSTLLSGLQSENDELDGAIADWNTEKDKYLSTATDSYRDLPENLNEFINNVFTSSLCAVYEWCDSPTLDGAYADTVGKKSTALKTAQNTQNLLKEMCEYFFAHEFNALVGSFRNEQDNLPVDFFFAADGTSYDFQGFKSRFTESRLAAFYLTAFLVVKYPEISENDDSFFDTYYTTDGKTGVQEFTAATVEGIIVPTIVYAKICAKEHMYEVSFDHLKLSRYLNHFFFVVLGFRVKGCQCS